VARRQTVNEETAYIKARFSRLTDEALLRVLTTERAEYRRLALDLAAAELSRRGVHPPAASPVELPLINEGTELPGLGFTAPKFIAPIGRVVLFCLSLVATVYVTFLMLDVDNSDLRRLIYFTCFATFIVILRVASKKLFPESDAGLRTTGEDEAKEERLKAELRAVAEDARDMLGLEWEARDVYVDSYGYHLDFYDEDGRLRAAVFELPPGREWDPEAIAQRLHELSQAPQSYPAVDGRRLQPL
jgi:hypothetical protein